MQQQPRGVIRCENVRLRSADTASTAPRVDCPSPSAQMSGCCS